MDYSWPLLLSSASVTTPLLISTSGKECRQVNKKCLQFKLSGCYHIAVTKHFLEFSGRSNKTAWLKKLLSVSVDYRYADLAIALSNRPPDRCTDLPCSRWFHTQCQHSYFSYMLGVFAQSKLFLCSQCYPILLSLTYDFLRNVVNLTVFLSSLPFSSFHIYPVDWLSPFSHKQDSLFLLLHDHTSRLFFEKNPFVALFVAVDSPLTHPRLLIGSLKTCQCGISEASLLPVACS